MSKIIADKKCLTEIPKTSGVYLFLDKNNEVLYIGKAKVLQNRLNSYFTKEIGRGPSIDIMVKKAKYIKYYKSESEIEAVLLEAELIKKIKPKHNIRQKDDKSFLVIEISKDKFPSVILKRFKEYEDNSFLPKKLFGPYPSTDALRKSMKYIRKIFPYRDCSQNKFHEYAKKNRPCLYGEIKICSAPCINKISIKDYKKEIRFLRMFLRGNKKSVLTKIKKEMRIESGIKRYEKAIELRNKINFLENIQNAHIEIRDDIFKSENVLFRRIESYDISNIFGEYAVGSMVVFNNGQADKNEYRKFKIKTVKKINDPAMIQEILERRLKNDWAMADLILVDGGEGQLKAASEILNKKGYEIPIVAISKGKKRDKNDFHFSDSSTAKYVLKTESIKKLLISARDEAHRFAVNYYRKLHQKDILK